MCIRDRPYAYRYFTTILPDYYVIGNWKTTLELLAEEYKVYLGEKMSMEVNRHKGQNILENLATLVAEGSKISVHDLGLISDARREYDASQQDIYLDTPLPKLNKLTRGLGTGQVWVIGAGSGLGKSYYAMNQAIYSGLKGYKVAFFSTELSKQENFRRAVLMFQGMVDGANDFDVAKDLILDMNNLRIYSEIRTIRGIENEVKRLVAEEGLDLVVIDHLHQLDQSKDKKQYELIGEVCDSVLRFTLENKIRTLLISQLNRAGYGNTSNFSFLGSGAIEQIAHLAGVIYKEEDELYFAIMKNRS